MDDGLTAEQAAQLSEVLTRELRRAVMARLADGADPDVLAQLLAERRQQLRAIEPTPERVVGPDDPGACQGESRI
jgi:hypothetical protein